MFPIYILQIITFLDLLAISLVIPLLPHHVRNLGASHLIVGLMSSLYAIFQLGSGPLVGSLSDLKGRKNILIITLILCSLCYTAIGLTTSIYYILMLRALLGLFKQTQILARALVSDYVKNERNQAAIYGKMAAISGIGITCGPTIAGHIMEAHPDNGFAFVGFLAGFIFLSNAVLVYFLPKPMQDSKMQHKKALNTMNMNDLPDNIFIAFCSNFKMCILQLCKIKWSQYWDVFAFKLLVAFAMSIYYSNYSTYLRHQFDLTPKYIGYIISFQGVVGSISSYFIDYINHLYKNDTNFSKRNFHVFFVMTLSLLGIKFAPNVYAYAFCLIPLAICNAVSRLVTLEMILKRSHGEYRGTLIGASNSTRALSGVIAPLVAGLIGQYVDITKVIYASIIASFIGTTLSYHVKSTTRYVRKKNE